MPKLVAFSESSFASSSSKEENKLLGYMLHLILQLVILSTIQWWAPRLINRESQNLPNQVIWWEKVISACHGAHLVENHWEKNHCSRSSTVVYVPAATPLLLEHMEGWGLFYSSVGAFCCCSLCLGLSICVHGREASEGSSTDGSLLTSVIILVQISPQSPYISW